MLPAPEGSGIAFCAEQSLAVAGDQVHFKIDTTAWLEMLEGGVFQRVRDQVDGEAWAIDVVSGQAGTVYGD